MSNPTDPTADKAAERMIAGIAAPAPMNEKITAYPQDTATPSNPSGLTWGYPIMRDKDSSNPPNDLPPVEVVYKNWRGEIRLRRIIPRSIRYGIAPPWHPDPCFIMVAVDVEDGREKDFALAGFQNSTTGQTVFEPAGTDAKRYEAWQAEQKRLTGAT